MIEFDPAKDAINIAKHGISLSRAVDMEVLAAIEDARFVSEIRFRAHGLIERKAYCADRKSAQSARRAHEKEMKRHAS